MRRRTFLQSTAGAAAALAAPHIARAQAKSVLKFIPQADLTSVDPIWTTADVSRNHAYLVWDTLYGFDAKYRPQPQMVQGETVSDDKKQWDLTLRPGLKFHDGTPVLARDVAQSIRRWAARDVFGGVLLAATDEISAPSDTVVRFRLKKPFPLLPSALANGGFVMPERIAKTDPNTQIPDVIGSGPFRFVPAERVSGSRVVYEKFTDYVPRQEPTSFTAGGKPVHFDRVVWNVVPDPATAAGALRNGEYDWWENPNLDLVPMLKRDANITIAVKDHTGEIGCLRFNALYPPFDNPAINRLVASCVSQKEFMEAVAGAVPELIHTGVGVWSPDSPYATNVGVDMMQGIGDPAKRKQELAAAGYKGEKIVLLAAANYPTITAVAEVAGDMLKKIGFNVDYQSLDWGTVVQRRASKAPPDKGGWNIFFTLAGGIGNILPAASTTIRANGDKAWFGWPTNPKQQALLDSWFDAPDLAAQQKVCQELQQVFWQDPSWVPLGMFDLPAAFRKDIVDIPEGFPLFYGVKRS